MRTTTLGWGQALEAGLDPSEYEGFDVPEGSVDRPTGLL